jgi:hypothetical protein
MVLDDEYGELRMNYNIDYVFDQLVDRVEKYLIDVYNIEKITDFQIGGTETFEDGIEEIDRLHDAAIHSSKVQCIHDILSLLKDIG